MATTQYRGITISVTKYDELFPEFELGPSWAYEIDGQSRPMWVSNVSEDDAFVEAKAKIDEMLATGHALGNAQ